jgi:hypothetical protein
MAERKRLGYKCLKPNYIKPSYTTENIFAPTKDILKSRHYVPPKRRIKKSTLLRTEIQKVITILSVFSLLFFIFIVNKSQI